MSDQPCMQHVLQNAIFGAPRTFQLHSWISHRHHSFLSSPETDGHVIQFIMWLQIIKTVSKLFCGTSEYIYFLLMKGNWCGCNSEKAPLFIRNRNRFRNTSFPYSYKIACTEMTHYWSTIFQKIVHAVCEEMGRFYCHSLVCIQR